MEKKEILNLAQAELRAMYKRLGIQGSNVLSLIDNELESAEQPLPASLEQAAEAYALKIYGEPVSEDDAPRSGYHEDGKADFLAGTNHILNSYPTCEVYVEVEHKTSILLQQWNITERDIEREFYVKPIVIADIIGEKDKEIERLNYIIETKETERKNWADMCIKKQQRIEELEDWYDMVVTDNTKQTETIKQRQQEIERLNAGIESLTKMLNDTNKRNPAGNI